MTISSMAQILIVVSLLFSIAVTQVEAHETSSTDSTLQLPSHVSSPSPTGSPAPVASGPQSKISTEAVVLAVVDPIEKSQFEKQVLPNIRANLSSCRHCSVMNVTPYDEKGQFAGASLTSRLDDVPKKDSVLVFLFNRAFKKGEDEALVEKVRQLIKGGVVVIATAGRPKEAEATLMISRTLWGQIPEVLIIGELIAAERLVEGTFFGPQMLTALQPVEGFEGFDRGALPFGIRLATQLKTKPAAEWPTSLREKKANFRQFWPTLRDFFDR